TSPPDKFFLSIRRRHTRSKRDWSSDVCSSDLWGYSLLSGSFTLVIMILPLIMRTTEEALKAVPDSYREASFGLGAGKLRTIFRIVLPSAVQSEEHTSELQSRFDLVCRLLLEKKKNK